MNLSKEEINALATDEQTALRGQKLANVNKWTVLGYKDNVLWGECPGSAADAYLVIADINGPTFSCSCPVRKLPCKHCMALMFMRENELLPSTAELPEKVKKWAERNIKLATKEIKTVDKINDTASAEAKEKRDVGRLQLMSNGVSDLKRWLSDTVSLGLANLAHDNKQFWENAAARFKDSKLSKVAYTVREIAEEFTVTVDNSEKIAIQFGEISLLVKAFEKIEHCDPIFKEELLNQLGRLLKKSDVIDNAQILKGDFFVFAIKETYNLDGLQERRVWLMHIETGKTALLQDFIFFGSSSFEYNYRLGAVYEMEIYYYPATLQQRAVMFSINFKDNPYDIASFGYPDFEVLMTNLSALIQLNPWLKHDAMILNQVIPVFDKKERFIVDNLFRKIPLKKCSDKKMMKLLALSGGEPISISGEFDFNSFDVLAYIKEGRLIKL
jgi:hypothetical protein